jgi:putative membrane protein
MGQSAQSDSTGNTWQRVIRYLGAVIRGDDVKWNRTDSTNLAMERTRLAYERTMMAWIRTGVSLISFGFSIYKFFQIQELGLKGAFEEGLFGPRSFGAVMILTGLGVVGLAGAQHNRDLRSMRAAKFPTPPSLALLVGALVAFLGFMGLVAVTFKA